MGSHILGSSTGSLAVVWSNIAVGAVLLAATLSFITALALTVGRGRKHRDDEMFDSTVLH